MDHDVEDHNLYNKMLYGWIKPYIVFGRNVTIDVKSIQHTNSAVILYDDDKQFVKNSNNKIVSQHLIYFSNPKVYRIFFF